MKKGVPPPPKSKSRVPPPPVPKMTVKIVQEEYHRNQQTSVVIGNQQKMIDSQMQQSFNPLPNEQNVQPITIDISKKQDQTVKKNGIQILQQKDQTMNEQFQVSQQVSIVEQTTRTNVEIKNLPVIKGVPPPPKSRTAITQEKKKVAPMKIPPLAFIPKEKQDSQKDDEAKKEEKQIEAEPAQGLTQVQSIQTQKDPQIGKCENETKSLNTVSPQNELPIQVQPQKVIIDNKIQQSPNKPSLPPTFKPGNKKVTSQIKPTTVKPPLIIQSASTQLQTIQTSESQEKKVQIQKIKQKQEKQATLKAPQVCASKVRPIETAKGVHQSEKKDQEPQKLTMKQESSSEPTQYSELQQKLRRLQQLRSKMDDESSEESYSNNNEDEIQEQVELQVQQNQSQQQQEKDNEVPILRGKKDMDLQQVQFAIGETNQNKMEINDEIQYVTCQEEKKNLTLQQVPAKEQQDEQKFECTTSSPEEQSASVVPVPAQTVYESNLTVEQSHRQYLPDQLSISPLNSQQSMAKHHHITHDSNNNVYHADKYRSQANFDKPKTYDLNANHDQVNEKIHDGTISEKSDTELEKIKHQHQKNQQHYKIRDPSNQTVFDKKSEFFMKENQEPKIKPNTQKLKQKSSENNIEDLLRQFRSKKSQYLQSIENLKFKQEKFNEQEEKYRERIIKLIDQVNHKNVLILKHTSGLTDIKLRNDKQNQTEEL